MMWNFRRKKIAVWNAAMVLASLFFGEVTCHCHGLVDPNESTHSDSTCDLDSSYSHEHHDHQDSDESNRPRDCDCSAACCETFLILRADDGGPASEVLSSELFVGLPFLVQRYPLTLIPDSPQSNRFLTARTPPILDLCLQTQTFLI